MKKLLILLSMLALPCYASPYYLFTPPDFYTKGTYQFESGDVSRIELYRDGYFFSICVTHGNKITKINYGIHLKTCYEDFLYNAARLSSASNGKITKQMILKEFDKGGKMGLYVWFSDHPDEYLPYKKAIQKLVGTGL